MTVQNHNFTCSFTVEQNPPVVFDAITNVRGWWTGEIEGDSRVIGDTFSYRYPGFHFSKQLVTELIPERNIVWEVIDARLEGFENSSEWIGTVITFDIIPGVDGTEIRFSHLGLVPKLACFDSCSGGWSFFVNKSLRQLITTGEGPAQPPWA
jgi:hypothetical protein